jgi:hypothetical protein
MLQLYRRHRKDCETGQSSSVQQECSLMKSLSPQRAANFGDNPGHVLHDGPLKPNPAL